MIAMGIIFIMLGVGGISVSSLQMNSNSYRINSLFGNEPSIIDIVFWISVVIAVLGAILLLVGIMKKITENKSNNSSNQTAQNFQPVQPAQNLQCMSCGNRITSQSEFCSRCGNKVQALNFVVTCTTCGALVESGSGFCNKCGSSLQ